MSPELSGFLDRVNELCRLVLLNAHDANGGATEIWSLSLELMNAGPRDLTEIAGPMWVIWGALIDAVDFAKTAEEQRDADQVVQEAARAWLASSETADARRRYVDHWMQELGTWPGRKEFG